MINAIEMVDLLHNNIVKVRFTKVDGSERMMRATLSKMYLPEDHHEHAAKTVLTEEIGNHIRCWDMDIGAWRSFRMDSVLGYQTEIGQR